MFMRAAKVAITEALREVFDIEGTTGKQADSTAYEGLRPKSVDIEYPEAEPSWPGILIQFHPTEVRWTGINPNEYTVISEGEFSYENFRMGQFEGNIDLTILALKSSERDELWDELVALVLMGDIRSDTVRFHNTINNHDLIPMTILSSVIEPVGDSIGAGVPWNADILAYEATMRLKVTGQFVADLYTRKLVAFSSIEVYPYTDLDEANGDVPFEPDGVPDDDGPWIGGN